MGVVEYENPGGGNQRFPKLVPFQSRTWVELVYAIVICSTLLAVKEKVAGVPNPTIWYTSGLVSVN